MRKQLSDETYTNIILAMQGVLSGMGLENGDVAITISTPRICDRCKDESKEAFPYYVTGNDRVRYPDLCNDCFDEVSPVTFLEGEELADWDGHDDSGRRIRPVD